MTKRFWKWNAIASLLVFIWAVVAFSELEGSSTLTKLIKALPFVPCYVSIWSCMVLVKNKKKPQDAIVGFNYDIEGKEPKQVLRYILFTRSQIALAYSIIMGLSFYCLTTLNASLRLWLMLGALFIGAAYILFALYDYAHKLGNVD